MADEHVVSQKTVSKTDTQEGTHRLTEALEKERLEKEVKKMKEEIERQVAAAMEAERIKHDRLIDVNHPLLHHMIVEWAFVTAFKYAVKGMYFLFFNVGFFVLFLWRVIATFWLLHRTSLLFWMKRSVSMWDKPFIWYFSLTHGAEVLMFVLYACLASHKERSKTENRSFFFWIDLLMTVPSSILLIIHLLADVHTEYGEFCVILCGFAAVAHALVMFFCNLDYACSLEGKRRLEPVYNVLNYMIHHFF